MIPQLHMNIHLISTSLSEGIQQDFRFGAHQVNIKKRLCHWPNGPNYRWPKGNIRHKMAVHNIEVQPFCSRTVEAFDLFAEASKICSQQRGRNNHGGESNLSCF